MKWAVMLPQDKANDPGDIVPLYWFHEENRFCYREGPVTKYDTQLEAEGAILWIVCVKGFDYSGKLKVVQVEVDG